MIKGKWLVLILILILLLFNGGRWYATYQKKQTIKEDTMVHLQEKGYEKSDINKTDVVNIGGNELTYATVISFKDEEDVDYLYMYTEPPKQIIQFDAIDKKDKGALKHLE